MLQLNKSQTTNTQALWPDVELLAALSSSVLLLDFTQQYDKSVTNKVSGNIINNPGVNGTQYVVFQVAGTNVPSPSGQYEVKAYEGLVGTDLIWEQVAETWGLIDARWNDATGTTRGTLLATERAYVSGSNEQDITQYVSPDENGTYITYNG